MQRIDGLGDDAHVRRANLHVQKGDRRHRDLAGIKGIALGAQVRQEMVFDLFGDGLHLRQVIAGRRVHGGEGLRLFALRQIFGGGCQRQDDPEAQCNRDQDGEHPSHGTADQPAHDTHDAIGPSADPTSERRVAGSVRDRFAHPEAHPCTEGGNQRDRHQHGGQNGCGDRDGHIGVKLSRFLLDEQNGQEHQDGGHGGCEHRRPDLLDTLERGIEPIQPQTAMALDVLQHHDAVVHGHPDRERDPGQ